MVYFTTVVAAFAVCIAHTFLWSVADTVIFFFFFLRFHTPLWLFLQQAFVNIQVKVEFLSFEYVVVDYQTLKCWGVIKYYEKLNIRKVYPHQDDSNFHMIKGTSMSLSLHDRMRFVRKYHKPKYPVWLCLWQSRISGISKLVYHDCCKHTNGFFYRSTGACSHGEVLGELWGSFDQIWTIFPIVA